MDNEWKIEVMGRRSWSRKVPISVFTKKPLFLSFSMLIRKLQTYCTVSISNVYREWIPLHPYWFIGSCHYCSKIKMRMNWKKGNHQFTKLFMLKIRVEAVFSSLGKSFIEFKKQTSNFRERSLNTFVV
ncbi:hypothetical protein JHK86_001306 [Glycine max]|nr:hypothetical protein JHK86_001306 [Glycine max]